MPHHNALRNNSSNQNPSSHRLAGAGRMFLILAFLFSLLGGSTPGANAATPITFTAEELLTRPTDTSININVIPASTIELYYEYKVSGGATYSSTTTVTAAAGQPCNVAISGLSANTEYVYHMKYHLPGETDWVTRPEHSFRTQRAPGQSFTFVVTSDTHSSMSAPYFSTANYTKTLAQIKTEDPDLWIDTGDTPCLDFMDTLQEYQQGYLNFRNLITSVSGDIPIFKAIGNHEQAMGWNLDDKTPTSETQPVLANNAQKAIFPMPKPDGFYTGNTDASLTDIVDDHLREDYYAWTWGDALFIVLDPYWYTMTWPQESSTYPFGGEENASAETRGTRWDWTLGIQQYLWLKDTLASSTATYKFVFIHNVTGGIIPYGRGGTEIAGYFEWGGKNWDGTWGWDTHRPAAAGWSLPVHQLMDQYNVTIFFHGHDHFYAKQTLDDIVYQEVPMSAATDGNWGFANEQTSGSYVSQYPDPDDILFYDGAEKHPDAGHLRVTVSPTAVTVDYVDMNDGTVTASYTIPASGLSSYDLTTAVTPTGGGTIDPAAGVHSYPTDSVVDVTATPASGYSFAYWSGACTGAGACQVTIDTARSVTAHFSSNTAGTISYLGDIGSATSKTSGATLTMNTTADVAAGDDIIIVYATDPNANVSFSLSDSAGNTYTQVAYAVNTGQLRTYIFAAYNVNALPSGSTITINAGVAVTARAAVASAFTGLADEDPLDRTSTGTGSSDSPSAGPTSTTSEADELLIGAVGTEGPSGDAAGTWGNSFTAGPRLGTTGGTADTNITASMGWQIVSETSAYTAAKSGITSRDWAAVIATFKAEPNPNASRITIAGTPLSAFSSLPGSPSAEQSYTVSGSNLTGDIAITAPTDFQISLSSGTGFASSLVLSPSGGSVATTTFYVRFNRATEGTSSGNITHVSNGATTQNVAVTGTAAPLAPVAFNIILGRPTNEAITANIIPDHNAEFYIEYGASSGSYGDQTSTFSATADQPIEIVIGGLAANTEYFYRIAYRQAGTTDWNPGAERSFKTQKARGEGFTFDIVSDSHFDQYGGVTTDEKALYQQTLLNVSADHPDFYLDIGDTFAMDPLSPYGTGLGTGMTEANADAAYRVQRPYMGLITHSIPLFLALGNHENEEGWNWDDTYASGNKSLAIVGLKARKKYIPNPIPDDFYSANTDTLPAQFVAQYPALSSAEPYHEDYYAWEWGDALFVVIDPFHYSMTWPNDDGQGYGGEGQDGEASGDRWDWSLGIQQYLWLKETLENSDAMHKFVFTHQVAGGSTVYGRGGIGAAPYFEWGGYNADGTTWGWDTERPASAGWDVPVHELMVENGVDIFFHGHDHIYAREALDGIVYLEVPKPDDAGYTWQPYGYGYNENLYPNAISILPNSGHIRVTVLPDEVTAEYVRSYLPGDGTNGVVADSVTVTAPAHGHSLSLAVEPADAGATDPGVGVHSYGSESQVTVKATPSAGYVFDHWSGACAGSGSCQVTLSADKSVTAHFAVKIDVSVTAPANHPLLAWQHLADVVDHYAVHRSLTNPYFEPGAGSWLDDVTPITTPEDLDFPDLTADLTVAGNTYYYAVVPLDASSQPFGNYGRTGAFVFGLLPGAAEP